MLRDDTPDTGCGIKPLEREAFLDLPPRAGVDATCRMENGERLRQAREGTVDFVVGRVVRRLRGSADGACDRASDGDTVAAPSRRRLSQALRIRCRGSGTDR